MTGFVTAPRIATGAGAIEQLSALGARRALLVVDPAVRDATFALRVQEEIEKGETTVERFDRVSVPASVESVERGAEALRRSAADIVVALGGGTTLDVAKGMLAVIACGPPKWRTLGPLSGLESVVLPRLIAIPTTTGSGSEASWSADFYDEHGHSFEIAARELVPAWAIVSPSFVGTLPLPIRSFTAAEAMAQALEALVSTWTNPFSEQFARAAIDRSLRAWSELERRPDDPELIEGLQTGATLSGLAASSSGRGLGHAMARALGSRTRLPYGILLAATMPTVVEFNFPSARDLYASVEGSFPPALEAGATGLAPRIRALWRAHGVPASLSEAGVPQPPDPVEPLIAEIQRASATLSNPRIPSPKEITQLFARSHTGAPVDF